MLKLQKKPSIENTIIFSWVSVMHDHLFKLTIYLDLNQLNHVLTEIMWKENCCTDIIIRDLDITIMELLFMLKS